jgi:hypothetical protein
MLWAAAQAYQASGETQRSAELLAEAYAALQLKAGAIPDRKSRVTFLHMPFNRELLAAYKRRQWPKPRRRPQS